MNWLMQFEIIGEVALAMLLDGVIPEALKQFRVQTLVCVLETQQAKA